MATYHRANVRGHKLFYREAGSKDSPTIVFLHGFPSSSHMFRDLIPQLADKFHVIAPDYLGFGYSDAPSVQEFEYLRQSGSSRRGPSVQELGVEAVQHLCAGLRCTGGLSNCFKTSRCYSKHCRSERECLRGRYRWCVRSDETILS